MSGGASGQYFIQSVTEQESSDDAYFSCASVDEGNPIDGCTRLSPHCPNPEMTNGVCCCPPDDAEYSQDASQVSCVNGASPDRVKRRSCTRQNSSIPGEKYLCQKDSKGHVSRYDVRNFQFSSSDCYRSESPFSQEAMEDDEGKLSNKNNKCSNSDSDVSYQPTCVVNSWGHFSQCVKNRYKYRRSDYSSESDEEHGMPQWPNKPDIVQPQKCHLPSCDLNSLTSVLKPKEASKSDVIKNIASRTKDGIKPTVFKEKLATILRWFNEFNDIQKNTLINKLLKDCDLPQNHLLSVRVSSQLHKGCPPNCQDIITWLPATIATRIMSYLDPVSLCRAAQVCWVWRYITEDPSLWRKFCCQQKWRLSKAAEHKQVISHMTGGSIMWKKVFAERFRLRNNWLRGRCTVRTFEGHSQGISCVQFDDTRIVSGSSDKTIKVWNIRTNAQWSVQTLVGHSGTVRCLHLEGKRLVSGSTDKSIKVWDLSTQESWSSIACKVTMIGHTETVRCLQVDDDKVVSGSYDKTLKVWDIKSGECRITLRGHQAAVLCVHFNDTKLVSGSCDKTIKVWNYEGACLRTLMGHQDAVTCLQFDSTRIVSGSLDCTLKFWDIHNGSCVNTIDWKDAEGHTGVVRCLQADSWRLVSAADDKTIKVWNLETGERLVTLRNHTDGVTCMQFNDFIIVSGSYDKTVKLWDFSCC